MKLIYSFPVRSIPIFILLCLGLSLGIPSVKAEDVCTHYVSTNGNNANSGTTQNSSWKTIQYGVNRLSPGDVLCIGPGTYHESVQINKSGTDQRRIVIRALNPNARPIIDGRAGEGGLNSGLPNARTGRCGYDGKCFVWESLVSVYGSNITMDGIEIYRSMGAGLNINVTNSDNRVRNLTLRNMHINNNRHRNLVIQKADNVLVEDNLIHHSGMFAPYSRPASLNWGANFSIQLSDNVRVYRNVIHSTWGEGIIFDGQDYNSSNIAIVDNVIYDIWRGSINVHGAKHILIDRNFIFQSNTANGREFTSGKTLHAIVVRKTEIQDNFDKILSEDVQITNNIIVNRKHGISINEVKDVYVGNNTILNCEEECIRNTNSSSKNVVFENNIIQRKDASYNMMQGTRQNFTFRNNMWSHSPASDMQGNGNFVNASPQFANADFSLPAPQTPSYSLARSWANNYKLRSNSPAINKGKNSNFLNNDFFGSNRTVQVTDIGAHEFGGSAQPTIAPTTAPQTTVTPIPTNQPVVSPTNAPVSTATPTQIPPQGQSRIDFNNSGSVDTADVQYIVDRITSGSFEKKLDLDGNDKLNVRDYRVFVIEYKSTVQN